MRTCTTKFLLKPVLEKLGWTNNGFYKLAITNLYRDWKYNHVVEIQWPHMLRYNLDLRLRDDEEDMIAIISAESKQPPDIVVNFAAAHFLEKLFKKGVIDRYEYIGKMTKIPKPRTVVSVVNVPIVKTQTRFSESQQRYMLGVSIKEAISARNKMDSIKEGL